MKERHVLGLSGGKDSAALAVFMRNTYPKLPIEYFFTDTGKELPEVYEFLGKLEGFLGKSITYLNSDRNFDFWLKEYKNFLPSPRARWCTRQLKIIPFENWIKDDLETGIIVNSYVAIRADEPKRVGMKSSHDNLKIKFPLQEHGIDKSAVIELLKSSGLGLPEYYDWRSRSGCTFCFFQQKIEWVRLKKVHPEAFEEAKKYEKIAVENGSPFTWSEKESLFDLEKPERIKQIEEDYEKRTQRTKEKRLKNPLRVNVTSDVEEIDEIYGSSEDSSTCIVCHK